MGLIIYGQMSYYVEDIPYFSKMIVPFAICCGLLALWRTFSYEEKWLDVDDASFMKRVKGHTFYFVLGLFVSLLPLGVLNGCVKAVNLTYTLASHREAGILEGKGISFAGSRGGVAIVQKIAIELDSIDHGITFAVRDGNYQDYEVGERIIADYEVGLLGLMKNIKLEHASK